MSYVNYLSRKQGGGGGRDVAVKMPLFAMPNEEETSAYLAQALRNKASRWQLRNAIKVLCKNRLKGQPAKFTFMVIGKTGEGKSTLINSLVGQAVRRTSQVKACTEGIALVHPIRVNGVQVNIYDTQGVQDGKTPDEAVFRSLRGRAINLLIVCVSLNGRAELNDCKKTIELISRELGTLIWDRSVVALTQANRKATSLSEEHKYGIHRESYSDVVAEFQRVIRGYIRASAGAGAMPIRDSVMSAIPFLPTGLFVRGHERLRVLPDTPDWISRFWLGCLNRCTGCTKHAFLLMKGSNIRVHTARRRGLAATLTDLNTAIVDFFLPTDEMDDGDSGSVHGPSPSGDAFRYRHCAIAASPGAGIVRRLSFPLSPGAAVAANKVVLSPDHSTPIVYVDEHDVTALADAIPMEDAAVESREELAKTLLELAKWCDAGGPAQEFLQQAAAHLNMKSTPDGRVRAAAKAIVGGIRRLKSLVVRPWQR